MLTVSDKFREDIVPPSHFARVPHAGLFGEFGNYAGLAANSKGVWPVSWLHLSHPTGHYVSRLGMRILNALLKHHAILLAGNSCAPGVFLAETESGAGWEQFNLSPGQDCGVLALNVQGTPKESKDSIVFPAEPFMVLHLNAGWQSHADYLAAMSSKYRIRAKKIFTQTRELELKTFTGQEITPELLSECATLLKNTLRDRVLAMPENLQGMLSTWIQNLGSEYHLIAANLHGKTVGFISWFREGNSLMAMQLGFDERTGHQIPVYQRLLHAVIEKAIDLQLEKVNLGRTATEIKSTLGATPVENSFVIFSKNRVLRYAANFYKKHYFRPEAYQLRNPFKDA